MRTPNLVEDEAAVIGDGSGTVGKSNIVTSDVNKARTLKAKAKALQGHPG